MLENLKLLVKSALVVDEEGTFCVPIDRIEVTEDGIIIVVKGGDPEPDGGFQLLAWFWVPGETVRLKRDKTPYVDFVARGEIRTTPGEEISYQQIRQDINDIAGDYKIQEIAVDRYFQGGQLTQELMHEDGFNMIDFPPTHAAMAAPCLEMENLIASRKLYHGGNRVMRWMASNLTVMVNSDHDARPDKGRSINKIDGIVALIMAISRAVEFGVTSDVSPFIAL